MTCLRFQMRNFTQKLRLLQSLSWCQKDREPPTLSTVLSSGDQEPWVSETLTLKPFAGPGRREGGCLLGHPRNHGPELKWAKILHGDKLRKNVFMVIFLLGWNPGTGHCLPSSQNFQKEQAAHLPQNKNQAGIRLFSSVTEDATMKHVISVSITLKLESSHLIILSIICIHRGFSRQNSHERNSSEIRKINFSMKYISHNYSWINNLV